MTKHQILVVESNADMQALYHCIFRKHEDEFACRLVETGEAALKLLEDTQVDLIVLTDRLPGMPGMDILQLLRARTATKSLPVIVVADAEDPEERLEALRRGADHYQAKGFVVDELLARIRHLVGREAHGALWHKVPWPFSAPRKPVQLSLSTTEVITVLCAILLICHLLNRVVG